MSYSKYGIDIDDGIWNEQKTENAAGSRWHEFPKNAPEIDYKNSGKDSGTDNSDSNEKGEAVGSILKGAAEAVDKFTQSRHVDYSNINKSSRGNVGESDLTQPGYSDYFARDNNGPV